MLPVAACQGRATRALSKKWLRPSQTPRSKSTRSEATEIIVVNPNKKTTVGNNIGYQLVPGSVAESLLQEDDYEQIRGALSNYHVWVTPYNKSEKYAGRLYVDQAHGDDTIVKWTIRLKKTKP